MAFPRPNDPSRPGFAVRARDLFEQIFPPSGDFLEEFGVCARSHAPVRLTQAKLTAARTWDSAPRPFCLHSPQESTLPTPSPPRPTVVGLTPIKAHGRPPDVTV